RCYIHGWDDMGANANTGRGQNFIDGITINSVNTTITNNYISDIHDYGAEAHGISGSNGLGNFTITNNFIEATGENFFNGGSVEYIPDATPDNIIFSHNYCFKRLAWDPMAPGYVAFTNSSGVEETMDVKNLFELKHATHVTVDSNMMENCWVGAD